MLTATPNYLTVIYHSTVPFVYLSGVNPSFPIECKGNITASKHMCLHAHVWATVELPIKLACISFTMGDEKLGIEPTTFFAGGWQY